jgi:hypothetical protein
MCHTDRGRSSPIPVRILRSRSMVARHSWSVALGLFNSCARSSIHSACSSNRQSARKRAKRSTTEVISLMFMAIDSWSATSGFLRNLKAIVSNSVVFCARRRPGQGGTDQAMAGLETDHDGRRANANVHSPDDRGPAPTAHMREAAVLSADHKTRRAPIPRHEGYGVVPFTVPTP